MCLCGMYRRLQGEDKIGMHEKVSNSSGSHKNLKAGQGEMLNHINRHCEIQKKRSFQLSWLETTFIA